MHIFPVTIRNLTRSLAIVLSLCAIPGATAADRENVVQILAGDYPPFEMLEPVEGLRGFDYEVVLEAVERSGRSAEIVFMPWKRAVATLPTGDAAGLLSCAYRAQREEIAYYSDQISSSTDGVYFRKGSATKEVATLEDLIGEKVGAVSGYSTYSKLIDLGVDPVSVPDDHSGLKMLEVGRFDYFYNGRQATDFMIKQLGLSSRFDFTTFEDKPLFLCVSKAYPQAEEFLADFNKGLAEIKADGTYALIHAKYK